MTASVPDNLRTMTVPRSRYGRSYRNDDPAGAGRGGHAVRRPRDYKTIHEWVCDLSPAMLRRFRCSRVNGSLRATEHLMSAQRDRDGGARTELDAVMRAKFVAPRSRRCISGYLRQDHEGSHRRGRTSDRYPRGLRHFETAIPCCQSRPSGPATTALRHVVPTEIGVVYPRLLDQLSDLAGLTVTADALLTQTAIASYLRQHHAQLHVRLPRTTRRPCPADDPTLVP